MKNINQKIILACLTIVQSFISISSFAQTISVQDMSLENKAAQIEEMTQIAHSKYFPKPLNSEQCTEIVSEVMKLNAYRSKWNELDILLDSLLTECGVGGNDKRIQMAPIGFKFEDSNLFIFWDGKNITLNEQAQNTLQYTMPSTFKNIITVTKNDLIDHKPSSFLTKIQNGLNDVKENLSLIHEKGKTHIIFTGLAYHDRKTYPHHKSLNEYAVGFGVERAHITAKGNRESISAIVFMDSHNDPEFSLSYELAKPFRIAEGVTAWVGINAGLTSRSDILNYIPVPYLFPTLGLSMGKLSIRSLIIPKLGPHNGDVIFLFGSYQISN